MVPLALRDAGHPRPGGARLQRKQARGGTYETVTSECLCRIVRALADVCRRVRTRSVEYEVPRVGELLERCALSTSTSGGRSRPESRTAGGEWRDAKRAVVRGRVPWAFVPTGRRTKHLEPWLPPRANLRGPVSQLRGGDAGGRPDGAILACRLRLAVRLRGSFCTHPVRDGFLQSIGLVWHATG
jgi:hypothetical protein